MPNSQFFVICRMFDTNNYKIYAKYAIKWMKQNRAVFKVHNLQLMFMKYYYDSVISDRKNTTLGALPYNFNKLRTNYNKFNK